MQKPENDIEKKVITVYYYCRFGFDKTLCNRLLSHLSVRCYDSLLFKSYFI